MTSYSIGGLLGRLTGGRSGHTGGGRPSFPDEGRFGGGHSYGGGGYPAQQQQPQVVYVVEQQQRPQKSSGIGLGGLALGAGAGLLGGALLADEFNDYGGGDFGDGGGDFF